MISLVVELHLKMFSGLSLNSHTHTHSWRSHQAVGKRKRDQNQDRKKEKQETGWEIQSYGPKYVLFPWMRFMQSCHRSSLFANAVTWPEEKSFFFTVDYWCASKLIHLYTVIVNKSFIKLLKSFSYWDPQNPVTYVKVKNIVSVCAKTWIFLLIQVKKKVHILLKQKNN